MSIKIIIPGRPIPKGRPRLGHNGRKSYVYTPPKTKEYEKIVGWVAKSLGVKPTEENVVVKINVFTKVKLDVDNAAKSILDGLNGVAYEDDGQVVELLIRKHKVKDKQDERAEVEIKEVEVLENRGYYTPPAL